MIRKLLPVLFAFLLCCVPLRAQWSGNVELSGGLGGMEGSIVNDYAPMYHGLSQGVFRLNYDTGKFKWNTVVEGKYEPNTTDNARMSYKNGKMAIVYKAASTGPLTFSARSDFKWTPSSERNYSTWILLKYTNERARNHSLNGSGSEEEVEEFSYYYEIPKRDEIRMETGLKTYRSFNSRNVLESSLNLQAIASDRVNTWIVFKSDEDAERGGAAAIDIDDFHGYAWEYRITPRSLDLNLDGDIHLQRTVLDEAVKLKYAPGFRLSVKHALDENSGATRVDMSVDDPSKGEWRDSTRLRETFDYLSVLASPYLTADFKWKSVEAHADYACQLYARRLNDDTHEQPLNLKGVYPVGKGNVRWTVSPMHSLNLRNELSVSHPDYLKICWYDRTAGYLDQLYRGNEKLRSPKTQLYGLDYELKYKRLISKTGVSYKYVEDEIDQTWSNKVIDGREYKVFEWLNSADSRSVGLSQSLGWRGKVITANTAVTYNQSRRIAKSDGAVKNSFDWKLTADISAKLGKGWSAGLDAKYQSKVATFFTIFKQYCALNAFVQKDFKKFTLYMKGRDLLDTPTETSFLSEETQEFWVEEVRRNRRIVVLGIRWKF